MLLSTEQERFERIYRDLRGTVNEEHLAHGLARLAFSDHLLSVIGLSLKHDGAIQKTAQVYFGLCEVFDFATLEAALGSISSEDRWERRAARELAEDLGSARVKLSEHLLVHHTAEPLLDHFKNERPREFAEATRLIAEMKSIPGTSLSALQVVVRSISRLAEGT